MDSFLFFHFSTFQHILSIFGEKNYFSLEKLKTLNTNLVLRGGGNPQKDFVFLYFWTILNRQKLNFNSFIFCRLYLRRTPSVSGGRGRHSGQDADCPCWAEFVLWFLPGITVPFPCCSATSYGGFGTRFSPRNRSW